MSTDTAPNKPHRPIRRFDVFAEYNRIKNEHDGMPADQAMGRAIWVAKVVAGRRGMPPSPKPAPGHRESGQERRAEPEKEEKFLSVGGEMQTDRTFEHEVVERMGRDFYDAVFSPAIEAAYRDGKQYTEIRDSIRAGWK